MKTQIVGIDCATDPKKAGMALGSYSDGQTVVTKAALGSPKALPEDVIAEWVRNSEGTALLALDAPLGWPAPLGQVLNSHNAGDGLEGKANGLFRRETDRFVKEKTRKQSLDVGADRIARTAHAALQLLEALRQKLGQTIPLAWSPSINQTSAIEVYPAATLKAHGIDGRGCGLSGNRKSRERVLAEVGSRIQVTAEIPGLDKRADALDAVICILAAHDFLTGAAFPPEKDMPVQKEGWIWVRDPHKEHKP